jgi:integrase
MAQTQRGVPLPDRSWSLEDYLDYWLEQFVKASKRPKTYQLYEMTARLYIKPTLGKRSLTALSVPLVQGVLNKLLDDGRSVRMVQAVRTTLSAALTRAQREELVNRNVARLVELPQYVRKEIRPWSLDEAKQFLTAAAGDRLFMAFTMLLFYGLRSGEVRGLRWCDIDRVQGVIHVTRQLQRIEHELTLVPVKTNSGKRDLPLVGRVAGYLDEYRQQQTALRGTYANWAGSGDDQELIFTTAVGTPIEARNFVRTFWKICNRHGLRIIKLHHLRHTAATLLKDLGVPARDVQLILGHASSWMTEQIYQHADLSSQARAIEKIDGVFAQVLDTEERGCSQNCSQMDPITARLPFLQPHPIYKIGGPGGTRTLDTLLKSHQKTYTEHHVQSVRETMRVCARELLIGCVAVDVAVRSESLPLGRIVVVGEVGFRVST